MHHDTILSVPSRKAIHDCVTEHAGAHLRDVARRCEMPLGTTLYHLDCLERAGLVVARRDGRYKRYFANVGVGRREKEVLSLLRHDAPRRIVYALLPGAAMTQRELCAAIGVSRSTLSFHVNRLLVEGVVERRESRPESRYALREPDLVRGLLARYQESLSPEDAARFSLAPSISIPVSVAAAVEASVAVV
jgi:predicted transcriptional regulator